MAKAKINQNVIDTHEVFIRLLGEFIGVAILAVVADSNETAGRIAVALMLGWLLIWLISNPTLLKGLTSKL